VTVAVVASSLLAALLWIEPAGAAATNVLADWQMNEPAGAQVMTDSSANGITGAIGSAVQTGVNFGGGVIGYKWTHTQPNQPPPKPERLIVVDDPRVNPGEGDYAITIRFRTTRNYGNMIQKGQSATRGGYFKWEIPKGQLMCLFRSRDQQGNLLGNKSVKSPIDMPLNDGVWHTVRCEKTVDRVTMTIDGTTVVQSSRGVIGPISNNVPLTIAGKLNCDQDTITCDYFPGDIDWVRIDTSNPVAPPPSPSPGPSPSPDPTPPPDPGPGLPPGTVFADDFASGSFAQWTSTTRMSIDTGLGDTAPPSARASVANQTAMAVKELSTTYTALCLSSKVNVVSRTGSMLILRLRPAGGTASIFRVVVNDAGLLQVRNDVAGVVLTTGVALGSSWHTIELCGTVGTTGAWSLRRDGTTILNGWVTNTGTTPIGRVEVGSSGAATFTANWDDVVVSEPA
jgi:hypothetical protein